MPQLQSDIQNLAQQDVISSGYVELFKVDATQIGGSVYYFTNNTDPTHGAVLWNGQPYTPFPISSSGWEVNSDGSLPQPIITVSAVDKTILAIINAVSPIKGLAGAQVTRYKTFECYLDNGATPDPYAQFPPDVGVIEQTVTQTAQSITWQLSTPLDRFGMKLPRRQILTNGDGTPDSAFPGVGLYQV